MERNNAMTDEPMILGERYQLKRVIGRGGMAEVWNAYDLRLGRQVAIKRLRLDLATDTTFQTRFRREAQAAAGLNHPNIVSVYDTGQQADPATGISVPYIVMELLEGETLRELLRSDAPIDPKRAFEYEIGILDALAYSHRHDIVHRDIKPANVMLTNAGQIKVMDFGIARAVSDTSATMTQTAAVIGTAQYLSPEQARGEQVDSRSDLYSAGCLLYELLTRRPPFVGDSPVSVAYQHVRELPTPPSQLNPAITADMDTITLKALAKRTDDRFQSAKEMRDECWNVVNGQAVTTQLASSDVAETQATRALPIELDPSYDPYAEEEDTSLPDDTNAELDPIENQQDKPKRKLSAITKTLITLVVLLLCVLGFAAWRLLPGDTLNKDVTVPSVIGFKEDSAKSRIEEAQLIPEIKHQAGPAEGKDTVIDQDPPANGTVPIGSTITITINDGPPVAAIPPGLVGMTQEAATAALKKAGFLNVKPLPAPANLDKVGAKKGDVVSISPESGTTVEITEEIMLYVASGRSALPADIIGMKVADARAFLKEAGYTNVTSDYLSVGDPSEDVSFVRGQVVSSVPAPGSTLDFDTEIKLWLASGESKMPNLRLMTQREAEAKLKSLGFTNVKFLPENGRHDDWVVVRQSSSVDSDLQRDKEIVITLAPPSSSSPSPSSSSR